MLLRYVLISVVLVTSLPAFAQKQAEMNHGTCDDKKVAEQKLSDTFNKILKDYASDKEFIAKIKASQQAWLAYRDAQMKALYPHTEPGYYGSALPMCECEQMAYYTNERLKDLKQWLDGSEEGNVCTGSIKMIKRSVQ